MVLNPMNLSGRTILVTGASSGIGRRTAVLLSQLGARLILVAKNEDRLVETVTLLEGSTHQVNPFDLSNVDAIPNWFERLIAETGSLHGLVHSAGISCVRPLRFLTTADIQNAMSINFFAANQLTKAFVQAGFYYPDSSIVFVSSISGLIGDLGIAAYSASKGALIELTRSLALELASKSVRINCVAPGLIATEMIERAREEVTTSEQIAQLEKKHLLGMGTSLDVSYAIAFLLANTGRWITGTTLIVDGGYIAQ